VWVANIRTRQVRQITWESNAAHWHFPIEWQDRGGSLVFSRKGASGEEYYRVVLPDGLWKQAQSRHASSVP